MEENKKEKTVGNDSCSKLYAYEPWRTLYFVYGIPPL